MITCKLVLCAESIVRDSETNTVSAFSLLEEMSAPRFPVAVPRLASLFLLEKEPKDEDMQNYQYILTLANQELLRSPVEVRFEGKLRTRVMVNVQGLLIPAPGELRARLELQGRELGSWSMAVSMAPPPA